MNMWFKRVLVVFMVHICKFCLSQDISTTENTSAFEEMSTTIQIFEPTDEIYTTAESTTMFYDGDNSSEEMLTKGERRISETILEIIEHFKKPNPEGIPGVEIPDPYSVPDIKKAVTFFDYLYLENIFVYGLSKLKVQYVDVNFEDMEVNAAMYIEKLQAKGTYRYSSLIMPRKGPFTVNITGLKVTPRGSLGIEIDGKIRTQDIYVDITFENIVVNFENLGALGDILQGFINTAGHFIFENIKPRILQDTYSKARIEMDKRIEEIAGDVEFPNTIAPLDMVLIDARKKVREMGYDPFKADDYYNTDLSYAFIRLTNTWITGLSSFHRIGDMTLKLENDTVVANFEIGTQKLEGSTVWDITFGGLVTVTGTASFSIEYISLRIVIAQPLDTRKKPILRELNLDVGNIQARCDGAGTIDYIIEFAVNVLPNLLRYQIVAAIEGPLKSKIQEELNAVNVEEEIKLALPRIDELAKKGFQLSSLRGAKENDFNGDEFFDF